MSELGLEPEKLADLIVQRVKDGEDLHAKRVRRFDDAYAIYRAQTKSGRKQEAWEADIRVPYAMQVLDTALVNMVGGVPRAKILPRHPGDVDAAKSMQRMLDYYLAEDHFVERQPVFAQQALIYGPTAAKNHWLYKESTRRVPGPDGNPVDVPVVDRDGPTFEPWDIYDIWWEPNARDVDTASYIVLRSWLSKEDLLRAMRTETNPDGIYSEEAVMLLLETGAGSKRPSNSRQNRVTGNLNKLKDRFELLEIWTDEMLTVVGERQVLMRLVENPYWHGKKPVVITQVRPDLFEMEGISETSLCDHLQQALWTNHNMRLDNMKLTVWRALKYRVDGVTDPSKLEIRPRALIPVTDHTDVEPLVVPPLPPEAYREDQELLGRLQLVTGINPFVSGSDLGTVDQNTATGVTALQEVASRLLRFKAGQLHYKGYLRSYEQWVELTKQFLTEDQWIRVDQPDGKYGFEQHGPQDIIGGFDVKIEGTEESLSRQQERGEAIALLNAFGPLAQTGMINLRPILERIAAAYGFDNPELLIAPAPGQQPPALPVAPNGGQPQNLQGQQPMSQPPQALDPRIVQTFGGANG